MPIAILGTGRSGTSMVTRMLNLCGLYLGEESRLWDPCLNASMNPTGFWEHCEIRSFMDRLFDHLGGTWENPPSLPCGWEYADDIEPFYAEAKQIIDRLFGAHAEWAWKLPKATVTIAFWQRVVPGLKFIICVRNPMDFAQSLGKYSAVSRSHLYAMWQYYNYTILSLTKPEDRIVTFYEDYFPCSLTGLAPLLDFADLPHPAPNSETDQRLSSFCDQGLKHYSSTLMDVLADAEVPYVSQQLYLEMLDGNSSASDLPMLGYREMLLPLLRLSLIGESTLDSSGAVNKASPGKLKRKLAMLRSRKQKLLTFFKRS